MEIALAEILAMNVNMTGKVTRGKNCIFFLMCHILIRRWPRCTGIINFDMLLIFFLELAHGAKFERVMFVISLVVARHVYQHNSEGSQFHHFNRSVGFEYN